MIPVFEYEYVSFDELYEAYVECRRRKRSTANSIEFEMQEHQKLYNLWIDLNTQKYVIGKSIVFCVDKPVKREVFAADFIDRIIHHLIMGRIETYIEKEFIKNSYSCRKGKGTNYGIKRCEMYMEMARQEYDNDCYIVKCDLKSFFMTIDKIRLYNKLFNFVKKIYNNDITNRDFIFLAELIRLVVMNEPQNNCIRKQDKKHWIGLPKEKSLFSCAPNRGLPIGNLTSQIFANLYLSDFDHYITETLGIKYYGRYVDDFFFIVKTTQEAHEVLNKCREFLQKEDVILHPKKLYIQHITKGVKFIGAVIKKNRIYISNRTKGNFYDTLKRCHTYLSEHRKNKTAVPLKDMEYIVNSINSYLGFMIHYKTYKIRKRMLEHPLMELIYEFAYPSPDFKKITLYKEYNPTGKKALTKEQYKMWQEVLAKSENRKEE